MSASSSSGDNEVVAVVPKATTAVSSAGAMREPSPASHLRSDRNRERYFLNNTQRIVEDEVIGNACVRANGGIGKRYSELEFHRRLRMPRSVFNEVFVLESLDTSFYKRDPMRHESLVLQPCRRLPQPPDRYATV